MRSGVGSLDLLWRTKPPLPIGSGGFSLKLLHFKLKDGRRGKEAVIPWVHNAP